jgi:hypothetical protein
LSAFHRARVADLAVKRHLPSMHGTRAYADAGGLIDVCVSNRHFGSQKKGQLGGLDKGAEEVGATA